MARSNDRLKSDAEEISRSLDDFLKERAAVAEAQKEALFQYNLEMVAIGEIEGDEKEEYGGQQVEHNILRHLHTSNPNDSTYEEFNEGSGTVSTERHRIPKIRTQQRKKDLKLNVKNEMPTPEEKTSIRAQIFKFLDDAREEEVILENEFEQAKANGDTEEFAIFIKLYETQRRNYETLIDYVTWYQPQPFNRAWANDPDYLAIVKMYQMKERGEYSTKRKKKSKKKDSKT